MINEPTCRELMPPRMMSNMKYRKDGQLRNTNRYPTTCGSCGDALRPGEAMGGHFNEQTKRYEWRCGAGRWDRP